MTVVGLWGVDFCDRSEVDEHFLPVSTRRVSGAWPRQRCPCLRRSAPDPPRPPRRPRSTPRRGLAGRRAYFSTVSCTLQRVEGLSGEICRVKDCGSFLSKLPYIWRHCQRNKITVMVNNLLIVLTKLTLPHPYFSLYFPHILNQVRVQQLAARAW